MEDESCFLELKFLEFRDKVRKSRPFPGEAPSSYKRRPSSGEVSSSKWTERIRVTLSILEKKSKKVYIYEVPNELKKVSEGAYSPRIVSIGPLHHGERDLVAMEEHKWQYMLYLLQRAPKQDRHKILDECGNTILKLEETIRGSYAKCFKFNPFELVEIMLVDGCFVLELFLRSADSNFKRDSDRIFCNAWMVPFLQHDLALLENQIPWLVLKHLFDIFKPHIFRGLWNGTIEQLALSFFRPKDKGKATTMEFCQDVKHLLDLLHNFYHPTLPREGAKGKRTRGFRKCATELSAAGIEFQKGTDDHLLDIRFSKGILTIPPLRITERMDSLVRNLIAFEQCSLGSSRHITSYAFLIKSLIRSPADIELLQQKEIITYQMGGVEDVLAHFNTISREVIPKDSYFGKLCEDVNAYEKSWWHRHSHRAYWRVRCRREKATLKRNYFSNTWRTMSVFAAFLLLFLTGLQTYYSGLQAYNP